MARACLICGSQVLVSQHEASGAALLGGVAVLTAKGVERAQGRHFPSDASTRSVDGPVAHLASCLDGLSAVSLGWETIGAFREDLLRHHFLGHRYLCLRCGARQNRRR